MAENDTCDLIIIGGGLVGMTLALAAACVLPTTLS